MKINLILLLTTALTISAYVFTTTPKFGYLNIQKYKASEYAKNISKDAITRTLDKKGCEKVPGLYWCEHAQKCINYWEKCPNSAKDSVIKITQSDCLKQKGKIINDTKCPEMQELLGKISENSYSVCCIDIQGKI